MIKKRAYAKINLFLNVLDRRKDGYHNLEMINAKIDLYDDIEIKKCHVSTGIIIQSNDLFLSNQDNVVLQCARYMQDQYKLDDGIKITIDKKIPYGAGLGGNSCDAAAVIHGIDELAELKLSLEEKQEIGKMFGADIPYCLMDHVAYVLKTGEQVNTIPNQLKGKDILLIHPKRHILTSEVFKQADQLAYQTKNINDMIQAIEENNLQKIQENMFNSLEKVVLNMDEKMNEFRTYLAQSIGEKGLVMTGSGSTFIQLIEGVNQDIKAFIDKNKDKFLINTYKIV